MYIILRKQIFLIIVDDKECEKYYEARMINPKMQVTPALVISHLVFTVAMYPIPIIGEVISKFTNNVTGKICYCFYMRIITIRHIL